MTEYVIEDGLIKFEHTFSDERTAFIFLRQDESKTPQAQIDEKIQQEERIIEWRSN